MRAWTDVLAARDAAAVAWVQQAVAELPSEPSVSGLRVIFARAGRAIADVAVDPNAAERTLLASAGAAMQGTWTRRDLGRALLLLHALSRLPEDRHAEVVATLIRRGEIGEQCTMLRILSSLPTPERFVEPAVDACRTNSVPVFEAIACDNTYPAAHFPDLAFDQMVMKAVFLEVSVGRIVGLRERITATTARMASDYAAERRAAGRPVPADVGHIIEIAEATP